MRKFIKAASLLLALALSLGLAAPAFAASPGELITPFQYSDSLLFHDGYASINRDGKRGFMDPEGNEFLLGQYDAVSYFNDDRAAVGIFPAGSAAGISTNGALLIRPASWSYPVNMSRPAAPSS